jgi:hypothetical protein
MMNTPSHILNTRSTSRKILLACAMFGATTSLFAGCSDDKKKDEGTSSAGGIEETWPDACIATLTEDYKAEDVFGDPLFTVKAGTKYLISSTGFAGEIEPDLIQVTKDGPVQFTVVSKDGTWEGLPFSSNCKPDETVAYRGVFADVTVYADEGLTKKLCDLKNGDQASADDQGFGYESISSSGTSTIYKITLGGLASLCDGNAEGYVKLPEVVVGDSSTNLVPFETFLAPR